jgi:ATP-dependent helicase/DNAse subunit B
MPDKFKAVWVSHSSIADFLKCPRLYYLRNVYKDPKTKHKITIMSPALALGQSIHNVIELLSAIRQEERMNAKIFELYDFEWTKVTGKLGGFKSKDEEDGYKERGRLMLKKIMDNPGPLKNKALKLKSVEGKSDLAWYWLHEEDNIILSGKIDWVEYLEDTDSIHIIDFKTGRHEEDGDSLQLPIYYLLAKSLQKRNIEKISYWYLDDGIHDDLVEMELPNEKEAYDKVYEVAKRIKLGRLIDHLKCPKGGCYACRDLEEVFNGKGEKVGESEYRQDIYIL